MRIKLGNVVLSLRRENAGVVSRGRVSPAGGAEAAGRVFGLPDIKVINDAYVRHIGGLNAAELAARMAEVTIDALNSAAGLSRARRILDEHGIVVIPSVLDASGCLRAQQTVESVCRQYAAHESGFENDVLLYQAGAGKLQGYHRLSNYGKTVFHVRRGQDEGMVDIFNCDIAFPDAFREIRRPFETREVLELLSGKSLRPRNLNTYVNMGIRQTRGFHVDSYSEQIKAFIYLTDVTELGDGPYTFVKGSHRESAFRRANRKLGAGMDPSTEAPLLDSAAITPVLARRGAMIISE
jgi:hypothetical protein